MAFFLNKIKPLRLIMHFNAHIIYRGSVYCHLKIPGEKLNVRRTCYQNMVMQMAEG